MGRALSILLPLVVVGYALWLLWRMVRRRRAGKCALGGCTGCPLADGCDQLKRMKQEEDSRHGGENT